MANVFCLGLFFVFCLILVIVRQHAGFTYDLFVAKTQKNYDLKFILRNLIKLIIIIVKDKLKKKVQSLGVSLNM